MTEEEDLTGPMCRDLYRIGDDLRELKSISEGEYRMLVAAMAHVWNGLKFAEDAAA